MPRPDTPDCPQRVYDVMLRCWDAKPDMRPSFADLYSLFESMPQFIEMDIQQARAAGTSSKGGTAILSEVCSPIYAN